MNTLQIRNSCFRNLIAVFILAISFASCHSNQKADDTQDDSAAVPTAVTTFSLKRGKLSTTLQIPGELLPYQEVDLYAKENSFVKKLYADVGSEVKKGQLLVTMDAPEISSNVDAAKSKLQSQQAIYMASNSNYNRLIETSKTPGTISKNDIDQAAARKNSDKAQLDAARSAYQSVADTRNYLDIRAPFDGVITARNVNPGAYVGPSGKGSEVPLFVLQQQKRLRLVISVPEIYTNLLKQNDEVNFTVKAMPNQQFNAKVTRLAGALDERLRSERLEMDVYNESKKLLPGMFAEVNIPLPASDSTFVIPKTALVNSTEGLFVIENMNKKAKWISVKKGRESGDQVEIYGNLQPGLQLIDNATEEIRNGEPVKPSRR